MSRHHEQFPDKGTDSGSARLQVIIRRMLTTVAIPSILTACASAPPLESGSGKSAGSSGKTVFYVLRAHAKSAEKDDGASPADKYVPLPSDIPIIERIAEKHKLNGKAPLFPKSSPQNVAVERPGNSPRIALTPPISPLSLKDGIWDRMRKRLMLSTVEHDRVTAEVEKIERSPGV
ncbi:MAG: hypothetical protein PHE55_20690, partial [Methylococcaceae bacterium]|nr:hypothetical protein [Methylococcaceae bacterium]